MNKQAKQVLEFWFNQQHQAFWFAKNNDFDGKIRQNFLFILKSAMQGECDRKLFIIEQWYFLNNFPIQKRLNLN